MQLVSEKILTDSFKPDPKFEAVYPRLDGYKLWDPSSWTNGHPHQFYARMREEAPVMWSEMGKRGSGFWSVTRYEDLRSVELNPAVFSSERGSINMAIQPRENWKPAILMEAAMNSLINLDAPRHMDCLLYTSPSPRDRNVSRMPSSA